MGPATCKSCRQLIFWVRTSGGKNMPINFQPDPKGNVTLARQADGSYLATVHGEYNAATLPAGTTRYTSHFANCANARRWRRRAGNGA
ncbi:MAG TPA: hypothetical protein VMB50_18850 [Myxococcales bacterium]|nr:hypothetical protein [Myxococcales bacterium]